MAGGHLDLSGRRAELTSDACTAQPGVRALAVSRQALNNLVNGKSGMSPEMAITLSKAFASDAETWLAMQMAYDLVQARRQEAGIEVRRVSFPAE